jgi:hypothetical protein
MNFFDGCGRSGDSRVKLSTALEILINPVYSFLNSANVGYLAAWKPARRLGRVQPA